MMSKTGPHVTPELFAWSGGRFWFATARRTLKARILRPGDPVSVLVTRGPHRLVVSGEARPLDSVRPLTFVMSPHESALSAAGAVTFVVRNAPHLAGFIAQGPRAFPRSLATLRLLIAVRPTAAVLLRDDRILDYEGSWNSGVEDLPGDLKATPPIVSDLPGDLEEIVENFAGDAVAAVQTSTGVAVLPANWNPEESTALVSAELLELVGAREGEVAIEIDRTEGYAMDDKTGAMIRGKMRIEKEGRVGRIEVDAEKLTAWRGMRSETVPTG